MKESLTLVEAAVLRDSENEIEEARGYFYQKAGAALLRIRDKRLWRIDYQDFDDYCQKRWGWTRKRADQLIIASETVKSLPTPLAKKITSESAARALAPVPREKRDIVVNEAAKNGEVTAPSIRKATLSVARPELAKDPTGREIHATILEVWNRREELNPLAKTISDLKCFIEKKWQEEDPIFDRVHQDILIKLKTVYYYITSAKLEYVCGFCQGKCKVLEQHCQNCHGTGLMTKREWEMEVPEELKRIK